MHLHINVNDHVFPSKWDAASEFRGYRVFLAHPMLRREPQVAVEPWSLVALDRPGERLSGGKDRLMTAVGCGEAKKNDDENPYLNGHGPSWCGVHSGE